MKLLNFVLVISLPLADKPIRRQGVAYAAHVYPQKAKPADYLHSTRQGYVVFASELKPILQPLL